MCTSNVLLGRAIGQELIVLGVIFQHSAAVILVPRQAGIGALSELKGRRLMDLPGSDDIEAMLKRDGVDYTKLRHGSPGSCSGSRGGVRLLRLTCRAAGGAGTAGNVKGFRTPAIH